MTPTYIKGLAPQYRDKYVYVTDTTAGTGISLVYCLRVKRRGSKMIKLDIQGYCSDCEYFDPEIKRDIKWGEDRLYAGTDTLIRCSHRNTCESIKRYLETTNKESQSKEGQCT